MIDAVSIVVVSVMLFWSFSIDTIAADQSVTPFVRMVWAVYPIADAVLIALLVRVLMSRSARAAIDPSFAVGVCVWLAVDIAFLQDPQNGAVLGMMDIAWMVAPVLMARAAWRDCDVQADTSDASCSGQLGVAAHGRGRCSLRAARARARRRPARPRRPATPVVPWHRGVGHARIRAHRTCDPLRGARPSRARGGARHGAGGFTGQVDVPGQHEPRDSHTLDHSARHQGDPRGHAPRRPPARAAGEDAPLGKPAADAGRGSPRLLPDRGRTVRAGLDDVRPPRGGGRRRPRVRSTCDRGRHRVHVGARSARAANRCRRPRPADPGRDQPPQQRREVHTTTDR